MYLSRTKLCYIASVVLVIIFFYIVSKSGSKGYKLVNIEITTNYNIIKTPEELFDIDLQYIINNENVCEKNSNILSLFIVTSYFGNVETRSAMRRAFSRDDLKLLNLRRVFLLGNAPTDKYLDQKSVEDENRRFGDIIQGNFIEAYRNLTYKHVMGLIWAKDYCNHAKFIVKMDDDIVVNLEHIPELLNSFKLRKNGNFMAGYVLRNMVPIREPSNKWYVTTEEYEPNTYPIFVSGWFYITNPATSTKLISLSKVTKYFWIDDTYVTGILANKLKIKHYDISQYFTIHAEYLNCCIQDIRSKHLDCDILIGPNGGNNNLFYDFNLAMNICDLKLCKKRSKPINETCVAERKAFLGRGKAIIENYQLH